MLALIGNVARAAGTAKSASKMLPGRSTKGKGGALVPQQRPRLTQFAGEAEKRKEEARPSLNKSAFFTAPKIGDPKKGATKMQSAENKVSKISEFFAKANKKRKEAFKSFLQGEKAEERSEREAKRENFATRLGKGIKNRALAPVKSIFDKILDAVGKIILAKIAMWAIDNPDAFLKLIQVLERVITISTDIFIGTVDFMGTVINEGYKLVDGFNDWTEKNLGQDVADTFDDLGGKLVNFLNAGLIVGGLLLSRGQQELGEKPESPDKTKPEKSPTRKGPKKADKTTRTRRASQEARKRYARRYGKDAAKQRFGGKTRGPIKSSVTRRGLGRSVTRLGIKMNPAMVKNMKSIAKVAKGIKIPIIGPLVMGITSYLGDGNLGKAVFVALGTGIGELLGTAIPIPVVGTLLGGILGSFIGDLLYDIIVKKDPGAALKKVQDAAKKIFETGKAVFDWLKGGFGRFIESFKEKNQIGIGFAKTTNWLALLDLTKTLPLLKDSFFPPQETPKTPNLGDFSGGSEGDKETSTGGSGATVQPQTAMITRLGSGAGSLKLTDQDYSDLAYIVSHEAARGTEDEYGVAAAVLNRVADPRYPDTIMGVGTAPGQFEAVFKGLAKRDPALAKKLKQNSGKIIAALKKLNGRTDFKGQSMLKFKGDGDIMFDPRGNFFHYAEQQAKSDPPPTNPPEHWKELLGALSAGGSDSEARIQTEDNSEQAAALQTPSGQGPTSSSASAVSTLGNSSTSQSSAVAKPAVGAQGMTPLPIPIGGQGAAPSGSSLTVSGGSRGGASLNSYYRSQLFGFLYKQG